MGFSGISIWQLLIILVIVLLLFGTKRLKNIGSDLGSAVKGFRGSIRDGEEEKKEEEQAPEKLEQADTDTEAVSQKETKNREKENT